MRRVLLTILIPATLLAADFWQTKDPDQWTDREVQQIRTNSPWAKKDLLEKRVSVTTNNSKKMQAKSRKANAAVAEVYVRWESAQPVLAATAKADPVMQESFAKWSTANYVVSVTGLQFPEGSTNDSVAKELRKKSYLEFGKSQLQPDSVEILTGNVAVLLFSRDAKLEGAAKSVALQVHFGKTSSRSDFSLKSMTWHGQPAL